MLRLVRSTILHGGYLTPKLFAPKDVWTQVRFGQRGRSSSSLLLSRTKMLQHRSPCSCDSCGPRGSRRLLAEVSHVFFFRIREQQHEQNQKRDFLVYYIINIVFMRPVCVRVCL